MDFSKKKPVAFNPRNPAYRRKLWLRIATPDGVYYHIFWRRIALMAVALAVMGWLGLAGAAWAFVKYRRGYDGVSYLDLAFYPIRRDAYRGKLGAHYITAGRTALLQQSYREGYALLLAGLARAPQDVEARKFVALTEARFGRPDRALKTLRAGVRYARNDLDYLKLLFGLLLEMQEDEQVIALARELLPEQPDGVLVNQFIALQAATAHYHRGRAQQVERLISDWKLSASVEGQVLLARCDWQHGLHALAIARLERQLPNFSRRDELYLELIRFQRELGHTDEARRYALLRQFNEPAKPGPRIDLLHTYHASGDTPAEQRELADYFARFDTDAIAMRDLAWFALDTVQPELVERVHRIARERKFILLPFDLARVEVAIAAKEHARALEFADAAQAADSSGTQRLATLLNALRAVALFGLGDTARGQVTLNAFLEEARVRATDALLLARRLKALGHSMPARRVLERACQLDPLNEPALAELIRLDSEEGDRAALAENLPKLLAMRKHFRATLEETLRNLNEPADAPLREQIRAALAMPAAP